MKLKHILFTVAGVLVTGAAFAADEEAAKAAQALASAPSSSLAAGIGLGLAAFGGAIGQGLAAFAALSGIARNPGAKSEVQTPMIIAFALIESLVIYALIIALMKIR